MQSSLAIIISIIAAIPTAKASIVLSQNFSASDEVAHYVNATNPGSGQWNAITTSGSGVTVGISTGQLQFTRDAANTGSFSRTTDFEPEPLGLMYRFTLDVQGNSAAQTTAAVWQVGSGFGTGNSLEANARVHSRFGLNFGSEPGSFSVRDIGGSIDSALFAGPQQVTWVLNNSGGQLEYLGPDNSASTVAKDSWDLWIGEALVFDERSATTPDMPLHDLKFIFNRGTGAIQMDNFRIEAIPEPRAIFLLGLTALVVGFGNRQGVRAINPQMVSR
jgi:hypothetical protein